MKDLASKTAPPGIALMALLVIGMSQPAGAQTLPSAVRVFDSGTHIETFRANNLSVRYVISVPERYASSKSVPLVLALHYGGNPNGAAQGVLLTLVKPALAELEAVIVRLLAERKQTLALAESCTGGLVANRITNVPGASVVFLAGCVTYSDAAKQKFLGVRPETLAQHGAVSKAVAREMAEGIREQTSADFALAVTGIAGPTGGTGTKPVGTVFIALASGRETTVVRNFNPYDRETFKQVTTNQALEMLRQKILVLS